MLLCNFGAKAKKSRLKVCKSSTHSSIFLCTLAKLIPSQGTEGLVKLVEPKMPQSIRDKNLREFIEQARPPFPRLGFCSGCLVLSFYGYDSDVYLLLQRLSKKTKVYSISNHKLCLRGALTPYTPV